MTHSEARGGNDLGDRFPGVALYRLYREEGPSVKRRRSRKRAQGTRTPMPQAVRPNARWSLDFSLRQLRGFTEVRSPLFLNQWRTMARPGGDRRLQPRELGPDCRHQHLRRACRSGTGRAGADLRKARVYCQRQHLPDRRFAEQNCREGDGVHQPGYPEMARPERCAMALHRSGQAAAERLHFTSGKRPTGAFPDPSSRSTAACAPLGRLLCNRLSGGG